MSVVLTRRVGQTIELFDANTKEPIGSVTVNAIRGYPGEQPKARIEFNLPPHIIAFRTELLQAPGTNRDELIDQFAERARV
ncbi:MAG: hypothetical protein RIB60_07575 [Phycisphaerales bacterium]